MIAPRHLGLVAAAAIAAATFGCKSDAPQGPTPIDASAQRNPAPAARSWLDVMDELDELTEQLKRDLQRRPRGDLEQVATRARTAAGLLRLGYSESEYDYPNVDGYSGYARAAETWLLEVALEADQGHGDIAADLFTKGRSRHCVDCHEAHDASRR